MADLLWRAGKFLKHRFSANTRHGTHSPFVYKLLDEVVYDDRHFYSFDAIEAIRSDLLKNNDTINILDLGAGSSINTDRVRRISDIAKNSAKTADLGRLMFRLVNHFQPKVMLELGTSLGVSTLYQALGFANGRMHTFEGCPETAGIAKQSFQKGNVENVQLHLGDFKETLPEFLAQAAKVDWAFIDGNHQYQPTMDYFNWVMNKSHEGTVLVFDDIYWSKGMGKAWEEIKADERVTCTIDLFHVGLVFLKPGMTKEDFIIKF